MKKNQNIPFHFYKKSDDNLQHVHGKPLLSHDQQFLFALRPFEVTNEPAQAAYPHRHDFYEVLYICDGEGTHVIDFERYPVQPHAFYFLSQGQIHFWQLRKPLKGYALLFSEEFLVFPSSDLSRTHDLNFFYQVEQTPYLSVAQEDLTMFCSLIEGIEQEFNKKPSRSLSVLRAYHHILLTQLHRLHILEHPNEHSATASSLVRQFKQLVSEHFLTERSVQYYANIIGISTSHLRDTVKSVTGYSPGDIIRQKLILEAKRLLAHSAATVAEIGYRLHFEDSSYFGRFFKRETGVSPATFRQQIRDKYQIIPE